MKKVLYVLVVALACTACGKQTATEEQEKAQVVKTMVLKARPIERVIKVSTNLQGYQTVNVSTSIMGKIVELYVEVGDKMRKGDSLMMMDPTQYNTNAIALANLEVEMTRMEALLQSGSVSKQSYDQMKSSYEQTKEQVAYLKRNTYVTAPFNGVISARNYEQGELNSGAPILVITETDRLKALIAIPETYIPKVKEGMSLTVKSEVYPDREFPATIEVVYPTVDASTHTFQCKVVIPNKNHLLRPGMYVTTTLGLGKENTIVVPYQTVEKLVGANDRYVFLNKDGRAQRVAVKLGQRFDEEVEVIAPEIVDGAEYVIYGQHRLVDGVLLDVKND